MCEHKNLPSTLQDGTLKDMLRLPARSIGKYKVSFKKYQDWCKKMGTKEEEFTSETVLISYFKNLISKDNKPPTLWSNYSMIRAMIAANKSVDISKHSNLRAFLKRKSAGYKPRRSKTFDRHDISKFLLEANDDEFLLTKVAFIIGLAGACKKKELTDLTYDSVKDKGDYFHFFVLNASMKVSRDFVVSAGNIKGVNLVDLIRKYINLRPRVEHNRFFVQYSNGVCNRHPVGVNTLGGLSRKIAKHLKLKSPDEYTGHCLRRSCTLLLADAGANISTIKRHGGWKSSLEAEGHFSSSVENKRRIAAKILGKTEDTTDFISSWGDEAEKVHNSFRPSNSTQQAESRKEMEMLIKPIKYTTAQITKNKFYKDSPLAGETSSGEELDTAEYYTDEQNVMKLETCSSTDPDVSNCMEETSGFCEEINPAESKCLIPLEHLELVHLDKMNKPVNEERLLQSIEFVNVPGVIIEKNSQLPNNLSSSNSALEETYLDKNCKVPEHLYVESIAEKVIKKLLSTSSNSQILNAVLQTSLLTNETKKQTPPPVGKSPPLREDHTTNQIQDIGSKVLRMFVIDKQIEELRQEKKDIYKEIFSIGEISSSLFNSWAQEKIRRKNNENTGSE